MCVRSDICIMSLDLTEEEKEALIAMKANLSKVSTLEGRTKAFSLRPSETDTFIVTPPKCGTTWISQICHQLRTGGDMDFDEIARVRHVTSSNSPSRQRFCGEGVRGEVLPPVSFFLQRGGGLFLYFCTVFHRLL